MPTSHEGTSEHRLSRRDVLAAGGAAVGALALGSVPAAAQPARPVWRRGGAPVTVKMFVFLGGALGVMPKEFKAAYEASHPNVKIEIYENSNTVGYPLMLATKQQGREPFVNMGFFNGQYSAQGDRDKMWRQLDYDGLSNAADIYPIFKRKNRRGIGIGADQLGLVFNTDRIREAPTSWTALWDRDHRGQVALFDYLWQVVYAAARLNGGGVKNMEPGWELWRSKAREMVRTIVPSNPTLLQVLANGTALLTCIFNGTSLGWIREGAPLQYVAPEEGAINIPVNLQLVSGNTQAQNEACHDIINEMISPRWCARWMNTSVEVPANSKVRLPVVLKKLPAFRKETLETLWRLDWAVVALNSGGAWRQRWDEDVKGRI